jgi:hypothetical protein
VHDLCLLDTPCISPQNGTLKPAVVWPYCRIVTASRRQAFRTAGDRMASMNSTLQTNKIGCVCIVFPNFWCLCFPFNHLKPTIHGGVGGGLLCTKPATRSTVLVEKLTVAQLVSHLALVRIQSQKNPINTLPSHFRSSLTPSILRSSTWSQGFHNKILYAFLFSPIRAICLTQLVLPSTFFRTCFHCTEYRGGSLESTSNVHYCCTCSYVSSHDKH